MAKIREIIEASRREASDPRIRKNANSYLNKTIIVVSRTNKNEQKYNNKMEPSRHRVKFE